MLRFFVFYHSANAAFLPKKIMLNTLNHAHSLYAAQLIDNLTDCF
jgi:hypothetical protein